MPMPTIPYGKARIQTNETKDGFDVLIRSPYTDTRKRCQAYDYEEQEEILNKMPAMMKSMRVNGNTIGYPEKVTMEMYNKYLLSIVSSDVATLP
ncbi:uncharacterized protein LOC128869181 [Anastrepha ludens]|uniref:uncharacterized protein LOC128869181 n=1 Tax=Anastrepha ludens TaxID=28586 RepID=UPI0023B19F0C|nr:uncharacterized protein LOC128869181 [Anastrepha ludens]